ncbi:TPA: hypothetical protein ACQUH6_002026 [Neisseria polysaccharea]|uniref:hypothetical protein n=1 Tax=Neisseria polysaccharea TaxID=489 RepID=UPI0018C36EAC|nr:hypothetical protein [Neisseria polysaccharea]
MRSNLTFSQSDFPSLFTLVRNAERYFADDSNTLLMKTRQFAELTAKTVAANYGLAELENGS